METSTTALQQEIERLNIIISALTEQNKQLKAELSSFKQNTGNEINGDYASPENNKGITNSLNASPENDKGITNSLNAFVESNKGITNLNHASPENGKGINQVNIAIIKRGLRQVMPTRPYATIENAAKILMLLFENPKQPYKVLRQLTNLSKDGMPKHIRMLKRNGLIVRTAFQTYTLTEKSINIIKDAMQ